MPEAVIIDAVRTPIGTLVVLYPQYALMTWLLWL